MKTNSGMNPSNKSEAAIFDGAAVLGVSEPAAKRWWAYAKAWLFRAFPSNM